MKRLIVFLLLIALMLNLAACKKKTETSHEKEPRELTEEIADETKEPNETNEKAEEVEEEEEEIKVILFFTNKNYIETGDESTKKLLPEYRNISRDRVLEEAIIEELIEGPIKDRSVTLIPNTVQLIDVKVEDGTAYVNFKEEGLRGSSTQETFTIMQIAASLLQLDHVEQVQFLVEGEVVESLMGHVDTTEPITEIDD